MKMKIPSKERLEGSKKDEKLKIIQFKKKDIENPVYFDNLEDLLIRNQQRRSAMQVK